MQYMLRLGKIVARCKGIDLGAWASEAFRLPERESGSTPDFEQG